MSALEWIAVLIGAVAVYHLLPQRAQKLWLLLLSYGFYAWWAWRFLPVLALLTVATYAIAARIGAGASPRDEREKRYRRRWLIGGVALNVVALALLRCGYRSVPFDNPFAVLGISFYSLQAIAYLFDTYSGALRSLPGFADFALYLAYFPKIVAGPIERPQGFFRQLERPRVVDDQRLARAVTLIAIGLTRKLGIADPLALQLPATAFTSPSDFDSLTLVTATVGFAFVLYNDFAGYTNIARGISGLFGIELSRNFAVPFAAHSFTNLWSRWHITFSHWLRDYIYLPVSRALLRRRLSRTNLANLLVPPITTMLVCGLWHGSSAHVLLWGGLHGFYLVLERIVSLRWPPAPGTEPPAWRRLTGIVLVFTVSCGTLILLLLPIDQALRFWQQLLTGPIGHLPDDRVFLFMIASLCLDWMQLRHGDEAVVAHWPRPARVTAFAAAVLLLLAMWGAVAPAPFIYQGF
jgi:D-alanyl-lipoteichoic acid acyltransferase DltB (MBOAT superfamily)